ncbi:hypothetical protein [Mycobacterium sp. NPDC006124]|uniref:hypothetical protein n=1 Tax=Mycobacterium sp. NPDC006124 TaxID=3156729 RepID=UPI0033BA599E
MTDVDDEHVDNDTWWNTAYTEDTLDTPVSRLIAGFDEIAAQPIHYNWLPPRARTFYGTRFVTFGDLADESIATLLDHPQCGVGTVKSVLAAARDAIHLARTTPPGGVDEHLATAVGRIIDRLSDYDRTVLAARGWALDPQTIPMTAAQLGVAPVNVQRNQPRAHRRLTDLLTDPSNAAIVAAGVELRHRLGPLTRELTARRALDELGLDLDTDTGQLLLHIAGPYARNGAWLEDARAAGLSAAVRAVDATVAEHGAPTHEQLTRALLEIGIPTPTANALIDTQTSLRRFGDKWVRWGATTAEKAEAGLHLIGVPSLPTEIAHTIGEHSERAIREALYGDGRFVRTTKQNWALRRWGLPEYTGVFAEIALRLKAHGKPVSTQAIVDDITATFPDVAEASVRSYLSAPGFIIEDGKVRRRTKRDGWPAVAALNTVRGVFRNGVDEIRVAVPVTADLLRGSGQKIAPALATALGVQPKQRRKFTGPLTDLTLFWRESATNGASVGSLRSVATALDAALGDTIVLIFDTADSTVDAALLRVDHDDATELETLLGTSAPNPAAALTRALTCTRAQLLPLLQRRGETGLLAARTGAAVNTAPTQRST